MDVNRTGAAVKLPRTSMPVDLRDSHANTRQISSDGYETQRPWRDRERESVLDYSSRERLSRSERSQADHCYERVDPIRSRELDTHGEQCCLVLKFTNNSSHIAANRLMFSQWGLKLLNSELNS
jgi:hypothetical protein